MPVTIRMARHGRKKAPFYRIVAADKQMKRDGRFLELLGTYSTLQNPPAVKLNEERVRYWIEVGAHPSDTVSQIISKAIPGYLESLEEKRKSKVRSLRAKRRARVKSSTKAAPKKAKAAAKK